MIRRGEGLEVEACGKCTGAGYTEHRDGNRLRELRCDSCGEAIAWAEPGVPVVLVRPAHESRRRKEYRHAAAERARRRGHRRQLAAVLIPVLCAVLGDPDQRAYCRAVELRHVGECSAIVNYALRQTCRARLTSRPEPCSSVAGAWNRAECRREGTKR